jgi:N-acetyl-alpha-D-muramate 1-phosphate uridylyltransferase
VKPRSESREKLSDWPVAILAGGLATRLRPRTITRPKALLEVAGQPFIVHQLRLLYSLGLRRIVLCLGNLGEQIRDRVDDGAEFGLEVNYSYDGQKLLGTGGALQNALDLLGPEFLVLYGDSYLVVNYQAIIDAFRQSGKPALMTVFKNDGLWDKSNVSFAANRIRSYNKQMPTPEMNYIDYGIAVLSHKIFASWAGSEVYDLAQLYVWLVKTGQMAGYEVQERFYEIGSEQGLAELDELLRGQSPRAIL